MPDSDVVRVFFAGLKESSRPGALGGLFLTLAALCVAVGLFRARWGESAPEPGSDRGRWALAQRPLVRGGDALHLGGVDADLARRSPGRGRRSRSSSRC